MADVRFTPTEQRIIELLSDGFLHFREELMSCLERSGEPSALHYHLSTLRPKLEQKGRTIITQYRNRVYMYGLGRLADPGE